MRRDDLGLARARQAGVEPRSDGTMLMIYSRRSERVVRRLTSSVEGEGWDVRLWALDEVAPSLAERTVGRGAGSKYVLLNRLRRTVTRQGGPLVLVDDDVELVHGSLSWLAGIAGHARLDVYQPAHTYDSVVSWRLTYRRPATVARVTDFVEEGPLSVLEPRAQQVLLPLPEDVPMGGGIDFAWRRLHGSDLRFGVVDAVTFRHLRPLGGTYERRLGMATLEQELARGGVEGDPQHAMSTLGAWRAWQRRPGW